MLRHWGILALVCVLGACSGGGGGGDTSGGGDGGGGTPSPSQPSPPSPPVTPPPAPSFSFTVAAGDSRTLPITVPQGQEGTIEVLGTLAANIMGAGEADRATVVRNGEMVGTLSFGDGNDRFTNNGRTTLVGSSDFGGGSSDALTNSGTLTLRISEENFGISGLEVFRQTSTGRLVFDIDLTSLPSGAVVDFGSAALTLEGTLQVDWASWTRMRRIVNLFRSSGAIRTTGLSIIGDYDFSVSGGVFSLTLDPNYDLTVAAAATRTEAVRVPHGRAGRIQVAGRLNGGVIGSEEADMITIDLGGSMSGNINLGGGNDVLMNNGAASLAGASDLGGGTDRITNSGTLTFFLDSNFALSNIENFAQTAGGALIFDLSSVDLAANPNGIVVDFGGSTITLLGTLQVNLGTVPETLGAINLFQSSGTITTGSLTVQGGRLEEHGTDSNIRTFAPDLEIEIPVGTTRSASISVSGNRKTTITIRGTLNGGITAGSADDTVNNYGTWDQEFNLGGGSDNLRNRAGGMMSFDGGITFGSGSDSFRNDGTVTFKIFRDDPALAVSGLETFTQTADGALILDLTERDLSTPPTGDAYVDFGSAALTLAGTLEVKTGTIPDTLTTITLLRSTGTISADSLTAENGVLSTGSNLLLFTPDFTKTIPLGETSALDITVPSPRRARITVRGTLTGDLTSSGNSEDHLINHGTFSGIFELAGGNDLARNEDGGMMTISSGVDFDTGDDRLENKSGGIMSISSVVEFGPGNDNLLNEAGGVMTVSGGLAFGADDFDSINNTGRLIFKPSSVALRMRSIVVSNLGLFMQNAGGKLIFDLRDIDIDTLPTRYEFVDFQGAFFNFAGGELDVLVGDFTGTAPVLRLFFASDSSAIEQANLTVRGGTLMKNPRGSAYFFTLGDYTIEIPAGERRDYPVLITGNRKGTITNRGILDAGSSSITASGAADIFNNHGAFIGGFDLGAGDDTVTNMADARMTLTANANFGGGAGDSFTNSGDLNLRIMGSRLAIQGLETFLQNDGGELTFQIRVLPSGATALLDFGAANVTLKGNLRVSLPSSTASGTVINLFTGTGTFTVGDLTTLGGFTLTKHATQKVWSITVPTLSRSAVFWRTQEYRTQPGFEASGAAEAYARGFTGAGQTVGVLEGHLWDASLVNAYAGRLTVAHDRGVLGVDRYYLPADNCTGRPLNPADVTTPTTTNCAIGETNTDPVAMTTTITAQQFRLPAGRTLLTDAEASDGLYTDLIRVRNCPDAGTVASATDCEILVGMNSGITLLHGNQVSGVVAAKRGDAGASLTDFHGIAFNAKILLHSGTTASTSGLAYFQNHVKIVNVSQSILFFDGITQIVIADYETATESQIARIKARINNPSSNYYEVFRQNDTPEEDRTVYVYSAGNTAGSVGDGWDEDHPRLFSDTPFYFPDLLGADRNRPLILAVVALRRVLNEARTRYTAGALIPNYHKCGHAKEWCLAAFGEGVSAKGTDRADVLVPGTSFAAPHVAGALAILMEAFGDTMGAPELAWRLLQTADSSGIYADSDIYGHGLLDIDAATRPVGATSMSGAAGAGGSRASFLSAESFFVAPPALGDSLARALRGRIIARFDALNAPFYSSLGRYFSLAAPDAMGDFLRPLGAKRRVEPYRLLGARVFGIQHPAALMAAETRSPLWRERSPAHFSLIADGVGAGLSWEGGDYSMNLGLFSGKPLWQDHARDASREEKASYALLAHFAWEGWNLHAGLLREEDRLLGGWSDGAFHADGARENWFFGVSHEKALARGWHLFISGEAGFMSPKIDGVSLLSLKGPIVMSAFTAGLGKRGVFSREDWIALRARQPLRVEKGGFALDYAVSRRRDGSLIDQRAEGSLKPSGRAIHLEALYVKPLSDGVSMKISAGWHREAGHIRGSSDRFIRFGVAGAF